MPYVPRSLKLTHSFFRAVSALMDAGMVPARLMFEKVLQCRHSRVRGVSGVEVVLAPHCGGRWILRVFVAKAISHCQHACSRWGGGAGMMGPSLHPQGCSAGRIRRSVLESMHDGDVDVRKHM